MYLYFNQWEQARVTEKILPVVRAQVRVREGRIPQPSAGLIDSQSVKGADTVGRDTRGYDAGKKINGRKRFPVTDTLGLLMVGLDSSPAASSRPASPNSPLSSEQRPQPGGPSFLPHATAPPNLQCASAVCLTGLRVRA